MKTTTDRSFSDILTEFLHINGLTQSAFAKTVGVKQSQVSEWLSGKAKPGYDTLKRMSVAYSVSSDYFLGISPEI